MNPIKEELKCIIIKDFVLEVLDQTLVPNKVSYIKIENCVDAWNAIKDMKVRGAPLIAVVALQGIKVELKKTKQIHHDTQLIKEFLKKQIEYLKTSRPTAVNLTNDLDGLSNSLNHLNEPESILENAYKFIQNNYDEYEKSSFEIARHGADIILNDPRFSGKEHLNILTICNTGKLAMPGIGTALGIIREINNRKRLQTLYIPETRPYNQGSRLTAFEAVNDNLPGILITDSMAGMLMKNKKIDIVIIGADRVTKHGATANKIGSYTFAVLAKQHEIPFYVACPISTIDFNLNLGRDIVIEERPGDELRKIQDLQLAPQEINVFNPAFDVTPPSLIESIITEKGAYGFDKHFDEWEELKAPQIEKYLKDNGLFEQSDVVSVTDVADGNLNNVFCVRGEKKVYCVKQALPWVKCVGTSWPLSLKRCLFEAEALKLEFNISPSMVPKFIHYNNDLFLLIMEFLEDHIILRKGLMNATKYNNLGKKLGVFVAETCFLTSSLHLTAENLRDKINFWNGNTLCTLTEKVVFSDPYVDDEPLNRWTKPHLDDIVLKFRNNEDLVLAVHKLRHKFISLKQAFVHGDLHSGSIMVDSKESIKVIDSEFGFYGPIGYDTGNLIAHLLISYYANEDADYKNWILEEIKIFWNIFYDEFINLWNKKENQVKVEFPGVYETRPNILKKIQKDFLKELFSDTLGFAATEIIRRIFGIAHVVDFEEIKDLDIRSQKEKKALEISEYMLINSSKITAIDELIELARKI